MTKTITLLERRVCADLRQQLLVHPSHVIVDACVEAVGVGTLAVWARGSSAETVAEVLFDTLPSTTRVVPGGFRGNPTFLRHRGVPFEFMFEYTP